MNRSHRQEYLKELMQYTDIDSYGKLYRNCELPVEDRGRDTLLSVIGDYQFVISFENAIGKDYVTEKFFNPLLPVLFRSIWELPIFGNLLREKIVFWIFVLSILPRE